MRDGAYLRYPEAMIHSTESSVTHKSARFLCMLLCMLLALGAEAAVGPDANAKISAIPSRTLVVGIKLAPPFAMEKDGIYSGLAIDLWEQAAKEHGWAFEYRQFDLEPLLEAVSHGEVDVGLGAITATAQREQRMDFAHTMISSGLGVAVRRDQHSGWLAVVQAVASAAFLKIIGVLVVVLLAVGFSVWVLERKQNPEQFGGYHRQGIFAGFWWAMVTMTTVGYGDLAPRSVGGRILGMVWMLAALLIVSTLTASITSALTVGQLSQKIRTAGDLASAQVASVAATTSAAWLDRRNIDYQTGADLDAALALLNAGKVDAVVYDAPLLRWKIRQRYRQSLQILPLLLERQDYAFALPDASPLREPIDASLLQAINSPDWQTRVSEYLGDAE